MHACAVQQAACRVPRIQWNRCTNHPQAGRQRRAHGRRRLPAAWTSAAEASCRRTPARSLDAAAVQADSSGAACSSQKRGLDAP
jgi:hypothetical protein